MFLLGLNFGSRRARRSIKSSKDADDRLLSKTILRQKNGALDWRPGPVKVGQKFTPIFVTSPEQNPEPKSKNFF